MQQSEKKDAAATRLAKNSLARRRRGVSAFCCATGSDSTRALMGFALTP